MKPDQEQFKRCPACGKTFTCHGDNDCWCEKVRIHSREMKMIMNTYSDCICPDCLKGYEKE